MAIIGGQYNPTTKINDSTIKNFDYVRSLYKDSIIPQITVPGDNDYVDYPDDSILDTLDRYRNYIIKEVKIDGQKILQMPDVTTVPDFNNSQFHEITSWKYNNLQFIGLNFPKDNPGTEIPLQAFRDDLITKNDQWIDYIFNEYIDNSPDIQGVVFFMHANPVGFQTLMNTINTNLTQTNKPGLIIHGHYHQAEFKKLSGSPVLQRLNITGHQFDWTEVEFEPANITAPFIIRNHNAIVLTYDDHDLNHGSQYPLDSDNNFGSVLLMDDFNGDGFDDTVIASPGYDNEAGAITIALSAGDQFGSALTSGDYNGDGYADLIIGAPGESPVDKPAGGAINVLWGSETGFNVTDNKGVLLYQGIEGYVEAGDLFGTALASGDFNGDGYDDLAIGAPGEAVGSHPKSGAVHILWGSESGFINKGQLYIQSSPGISDEPEDGDRFGETLAAGDINGDGIVAGGVENGDEFGHSLTSGDFNNDGIDDLVIGIPSDNTTDIDNAGDRIQILWGESDKKLSVSKSLRFPRFEGYPTVASINDEFGSALATGDFNNDGYSDLIVGIPGDNKIMVLHGTILKDH